MYELEGKPDEVNIFELARVLDGLGSIIQEANRVVNGNTGEIVLNVKPFKEGSFWMDVVATMQASPGMLFFLAHPEAIQQIKLVFESLGLIRKGAKAVNTVLDVIKFLQDGRPAKVEQVAPEVFKYENKNGEQINVNLHVHKLVNNGTIQNNFYGTFGRPLEREGVTGLKTFILNEPDSAVETRKEDTPAIRAYTIPAIEEPKEETVENTTTAFLHPKAGTYGETSGTWTFRIAGQNAR